MRFLSNPGGGVLFSELIKIRPPPRKIEGPLKQYYRWKAGFPFFCWVLMIPLFVALVVLTVVFNAFGRLDASRVLVVLFFVFAGLFVLNILVGLVFKVVNGLKYRKVLRYGRVMRATVDPSAKPEEGMVRVIVGRGRVRVPAKLLDGESMQVLYHRDVPKVVVPLSELAPRKPTEHS